MRIEHSEKIESSYGKTPRGLSFEEMILLTFENAQARDAYLPHPEHLKFVGFLGDLGVLEDAFVADYMPQH